MTSLLRLALLSATALTLSPHLASAGPLSGLAEITFGFAVPNGDAGYEELFTGTAKYGARFGGLLEVASTTGNGVSASASLGLDVGGDYTKMDVVEQSEDALSIERWRITAGPRVVFASGRALIFARAGVGLDRMEIEFTDFLGVICKDTHIDGLALEGSAGVGARFNHFFVGLQVGASTGDHHDDRPACTGLRDGVKIDVLDNRNTDLDGQLIAGWLF